jgi:hypothetical protein
MAIGIKVDKKRIPQEASFGKKNKQAFGGNFSEPPIEERLEISTGGEEIGEIGWTGFQLTLSKPEWKKTDNFGSKSCAKCGGWKTASIRKWAHEFSA